MSIDSKVAASISWRALEIVQSSIASGGVMMFENDELRIIGPAPKENMDGESGILELTLKAGSFTPIDVIIFQEQVDGVSHRTVMETKDVALWKIVDDLTAAFFPNSNCWPVANC